MHFKSSLPAFNWQSRAWTEDKTAINTIPKFCHILQQFERLQTNSSHWSWTKATNIWWQCTFCWASPSSWLSLNALWCGEAEEQYDLWASFEEQSPAPPGSSWLLGLACAGAHNYYCLVPGHSRGCKSCSGSWKVTCLQEGLPQQKPATALLESSRARSAAATACPRAHKDQGAAFWDLHDFIAFSTSNRLESLRSGFFTTA